MLDDERLTHVSWGSPLRESTPKAIILQFVHAFKGSKHGFVIEKKDNPSRDEVLKRMLKMKPQPHKDRPSSDTAGRDKGHKRKKGKSD